MVVRWINEREKGGIMHPGDACSNTGKPVLDVIVSKQPEAHAPSSTSLDAYPGRPPELVPVNFLDGTVIEVVQCLSGGAGPGGTYSIILNHWLLRFIEASGDLRIIVAEFV